MSPLSSTSAGQVQLEWARVLFESLADAGVTDVVLSPGSRSTPLVLAATLTPRLRLHDVVDERSAAFFALGHARATGRPAVVVCTSGTAGAHYLPAVVEAAMSFVPLIVLTADRPFELQGAGALQTIDQVKLFGDHARAYVELGLPEAGTDALRALRRRAAQLVFAAKHPTPGAVHANARARKPLEPTAEELGLGLSETASAVLARPIPRGVAPRLVPPADEIAALAARLARAERGVLVAGPGAAPTPAARDAVLALARRTGSLLFPEATSGLRFLDLRRFEGVEVVPSFDVLLRSPTFREHFTPDLVVQLGARPTSAGMDRWLSAHREVVIAPHGLHDPESSASLHLACEVELAARALVEALGGERHAGTLAPTEAIARGVVDEELARGGFGEGLVVRTVVERARRGTALMVGNGLPIRHLDTFVPHGLGDLDVFSQRGASGIDGLVSGAAGTALARGDRVTLLLGDVSLLHDLGGLFAAAKAPLTIVAIHNDGGRIFEQLPVARLDLPPGTIGHFTTPHGLSFAGAAGTFGIPHREVTEAGGLAGALEDADRSGRAMIIEAKVAPDGARHAYSALWAAVDRRLGGTIHTWAATTRPRGGTES